MKRPMPPRGRAPSRPASGSRPAHGRPPVRSKVKTFAKPAQPSHVWRRNQGPATGIAQDVLCPVKAACGSCRYVNLDYAASLAEKHQAGLGVLAAAGVSAGAHTVPPVESPKPHGYRSLFKLAVRPAAPNAAGSRFGIGLFHPGTHAVVDIDACPLHTAALHRLLADLRTELEASPLSPFDEATGEGQLRYLAARSAHLTGEILLTFVVSTAAVRPDLRRITAQLQRRGHKINAAHMNIHSGTGNAIFGPTTERISGGAGLRERLCELDFEVGPTAFFQVNPWQAINLYRRVEQIAGPAGDKGMVAWDLYCGTGQIALMLARLGYRVAGIEENPEAVENARANARRNHLEQKTEFIAGRVEDEHSGLPAWAEKPSLIVVNPSRRGLAEPTRRALALRMANSPGLRLVYVSCDVTTLARDLKDLTERTQHRVRQIEAYDMFAQTEDLEWLAVLTR